MRENFENSSILSGGNEHIPLAEIILMVGFFLIYFTEEFVHSLCDAKLDADHDVAIENFKDTLKCGIEECIEEQQGVVDKRRKQSVGVHR